ncbi:uncharacterized protein LOC128822613 isoform X1 [Vidua macroura]|uniref:uncharacterized protein LOC128821614 isoform X1 n=1 Tax=Vidua macroura TaxID=187451 RepID=UPI0023A864DD|nr:uncharacterized protein LOC128821614 isoform X1 [Vidua macroura]XP_053859137.1 uncharacterized protein LOC128821829 isoform X1 [Vidua macroura]XP_053859802.1 uncharacterized protein LOC128822190 isoform X1 [Vidua macroura]XP_053859865.1 uncharacterized protein LOC128822239 isoform X1 [Vidua macroura]XP_053860353.1 uncharacterized protein LOC128822613 isoform X1 [Vidua macroura]
MSRHRRVLRRQPGGAAGDWAAGAAGRARAEALREVGVDEVVEMAVQLALERFRSGDEAGARHSPARGQPAAVGRALAAGQGGDPAPLPGPSEARLGCCVRLWAPQHRDREPLQGSGRDHRDEMREMEFPSSFTSTERAFVHRLCQSLGLVSKSKG